MNKSERVEAGYRELHPSDLRKVVELLGERVREHYPDPPDDDLKSRDTYYSLRPETRDWLMGADKKKLDKLDHMLDDYSAAQQIGKFIKLFFWAMAGIIGFTFTTVKALPDILSWLRGVLLK